MQTVADSIHTSQLDETEQLRPVGGVNRALSFFNRLSGDFVIWQRWLQVTK